MSSTMPLNQIVQHTIETWAIDDLLDQDATTLTTTALTDPSLLLELADTASQLWGTDEKPLAEALAWHLIDSRRPGDRRWPA